MFDWQLQAHRPPVAPMEVEKRQGKVPADGFCSIQPANTYTDGLRAAASGVCLYVYGQPYEERMLVTHEDLYCHNYPHPLETPDLAGILPEVRRLLREGRSEEACRLSIREAEKQGYADLAKDDMPYDASSRHPACQVILRTRPEEETTDYLRTLDFESGEAQVYFTNRRGNFRRSAFTSVQDRICALRLQLPEGEKVVISLRAEDAGSHIWERLEMPEGMEKRAFVHGNCLALGCLYDPELMQGRGYGILLTGKAANGKLTFSEEGLTFENGTEGELFWKVVPMERYSDEALRREAEAFAKLSLSYEDLLQENKARFTKAMTANTLKLDGSEEERLLAAEELLARQHSQPVSPALVERLYQMGRYFLYTETGARPPQIGQYNININLQVCAGKSTGLWDEMRTFFRFVEFQTADYEENAQRLFGCRGMLMPIHPYTDNGRLTHFSYRWPHHYWISCAAWVYNEFWNHYLVTGDKEFLRRDVLPGLEKIGLFYEDYLSQRDENGALLFSPGMSPECTPKGPGYSSVMENTTMDIMACAEVLTHLVEACDELGIDSPKRIVWEKMLSEMPPLQLDEEGGLREWSLPNVPEDYNHRCVSHHYALWPAHMVTWERTPEVAKAIQISNRKRAQENDSAHGIMHRLFCALRLRDLDDVEHNFRQVMEHGFIRDNLMTNHYPYCVFFPDITGSYPEAMVEMLAFSEPGTVELLPALPEYFHGGNASHIHLYCFAEAEKLSWNRREGWVRATLRSVRDQQLTLRCHALGRTIRVNGGEIIPFNGESTLTMKKDVPVEIEIKEA